MNPGSQRKYGCTSVIGNRRIKKPAKLESKASACKSPKSNLLTGGISIKPKAQVCSLSSTENSRVSPNKNLSGTRCDFQANFIDAIRGPLGNEQGVHFPVRLEVRNSSGLRGRIIACRRPFGKDSEKI